MNEILGYLKIPNSDEVAEILYDRAEKTNGRFVLRSIVRACQKVNEKSDDPEKMAEILFPHASQIDFRQIEEYEKSNWGFRARGESTLKYWENVGQRYQEKT
ncbi:hypothetical protein HZB88_02305 [archaeon]|nr:hypothetical protein [archaeon]